MLNSNLILNDIAFAIFPSNTTLFTVTIHMALSVGNVDIVFIFKISVEMSKVSVRSN